MDQWSCGGRSEKLHRRQRQGKATAVQTVQSGTSEKIGGWRNKLADGPGPGTEAEAGTGSNLGIGKRSRRAGRTRLCPRRSFCVCVRRTEPFTVPFQREVQRLLSHPGKRTGRLAI